MQTFLPYEDFEQTAAVLDRSRLGKQRVETLQLLKALTTGGAWSKHPCARQWSSHLDWLVAYGVAVCNEWLKRGYKDTCLDKILAYNCGSTAKPWWLGHKAYHLSHQSNLLRKLPSHYSSYFTVRDDLGYLWPL